MEKRTIIAIILIMVIYWVASEYFWKPKTIENAQTQTVQTVEDTNTKQNDAGEKQTELISTPVVNQAVELDENIVIENDQLKLTFTNKGGNLKSIVVKDYSLADKQTPVQLIPEDQDLTNIVLKTSDGYISLADYNLKFEHSQSDSAQVLTFYFESENGTKLLSKVFTLYDDYTLDFKFINESYASLDGYTIGFDSGIMLTEESTASTKDKKNSFKLISQVGNKYEQVTLYKINKEIGKMTNQGTKDATLKHYGSIDWAAVRSKYFIYALIPEKKIESKGIDIFASEDSPAFVYNVDFSKRSSVFEDNYQLYLGPVDYSKLSAFNNGMEDIAELGSAWLRWLSKLFLHFLNFLNKFITNWGIVIIIFALVLKLLLSPLTNKTMQSAKKMQEINPLMQEIQKQYKSDPQRMNQELQKLYKEHKINPLGGCLPLLLQMPIFFALYPVLRSSIDLRQAEFFGWLADLSEPDKFWVLPILMGISMFVQQKMTMANTSPEDLKKMDEKQQAQIQSQKMMMYIMPIFMFFIFKSLPSGLVLYWMVFNVFQIVQQLYKDYKKKA
ncbi:MAG TPA: membrane protein insertase YidC [Candidatus Cloacimonadota bacterium]|nr:membrane protein insertase YidC [Candidatus Cloacimonadales bacterium]HPY96215.1 membrane protein insertase YidC [Candidatus Cloacimonadota bacterium]HQB40791.1 membrane protein insertase YidC [Candidatus Cloacimonadota bacterium]